MTKINLVDVEVENLVLGEIVFDAPGQHHFADLAPECPLGAEQEALDRLLGDGRCALLDPAPHHICQGGAKDPRVVQTPVLKEVLVLGGHEGELGDPGDLCDGNQPAPLLVELGDQLAVAVEHDAGQGWLVVFHPAQVREIAQVLVVEPVPGHSGEDEQQEAASQEHPGCSEGEERHVFSNA